MVWTTTCLQEFRSKAGPSGAKHAAEGNLCENAKCASPTVTEGLVSLGKAKTVHRETDRSHKTISYLASMEP